jgi:hypothetical protein
MRQGELRALTADDLDFESVSEARLRTGSPNRALGV